MNWNELEKLWQNQGSAFAAPAWDVKEFAAHQRSLSRRLAWRDWTEVAVSLSVAGVFAAVLWLLEIRDWRGWIGVLLVLGVGLKFAHERRRAALRRPTPEAPLLAQLDAEIVELRHQAALLRRVGKWYLAPLAVAFGFLGWAFVRHLAAAGVAVNVAPLMWIGGSTLGIFVGVWWLNDYTARSWIDPQLAARERARAELLGIAR